MNQGRSYRSYRPGLPSIIANAGLPRWRAQGVVGYASHGGSILVWRWPSCVSQWKHGARNQMYQPLGSRRQYAADLYRKALADFGLLGGRTSGGR